MSSRWVNLIVLFVFLLTVPAGVFVYFTSPSMGYPKSTAGIIAGVLAAKSRPSYPWVPCGGLTPGEGVTG
jgi:hypothetical protein